MFVDSYSRRGLVGIHNSSYLASLGEPCDCKACMTEVSGL